MVSKTWNLKKCVLDIKLISIDIYLDRYLVIRVPKPQGARSPALSHPAIKGSHPKRHESPRDRNELPPLHGSTPPWCLGPIDHRGVLRTSVHHPRSQCSMPGEKKTSRKTDLHGIILYHFHIFLYSTWISDRARTFVVCVKHPFLSDMCSACMVQTALPTQNELSQNAFLWTAQFKADLHMKSVWWLVLGVSLASWLYTIDHLDTVSSEIHKFWQKKCVL